ncbi:MAG: hypothetical protein K2M05_08045 [Paramuribaculum sp.]|nr:hypothetical protein [Paramuribaculum sp.]MDE6304469.1 hypothetical protein [Paramuribaculum sp.]
MKKLLFPHIFQSIGWIMFIPAMIAGALIYFNILGFSANIETVVYNLVIIGIALGALFIVCSKERIEDEMIQSIRLASLLNSIYVYVAMLIIFTIVFNGFDFLRFAVINLVLLPILFVINFRLEIHRYNKIS